MLSFHKYLEMAKTEASAYDPYTVALNAIESAARKTVHFELLQTNSNVLTQYYRALKDVVDAIGKLRTDIRHGHPQSLATGPENVS